MKVFAKFTAGAATLVALSAFATTAGASIWIGGGATAGSIPAGLNSGNATPQNDFLNDVGGSFGLGYLLPNGNRALDGFFGAEILGDATRYVYDFFGSEAGYKNDFLLDEGSGYAQIFTDGGNTGGGNRLFGTPGSPLASYTSESLAFAFRSTTGGGTELPLAKNDGSNPDDSDGSGDDQNIPNFFAYQTGNQVWLFLDDGGADENDNHDDLVVRISAVPLPAAGLVLLTALGGAAAAYRRRKA